MTDIACRDEDVPQACFMGKSGSVDDILDVCKRLGIGVGNAGTMMLQAEVDHFFWREAIVTDDIRCSLRDVVVLAVETAEVATRTSNGKAGGAWVEMIERFLLDGVDGYGTGA